MYGDAFFVDADVGADGQVLEDSADHFPGGTNAARDVVLSQLFSDYQLAVLLHGELE